MKQSGTAKDMIFDVPQLISFVSGIMKLEVRYKTIQTLSRYAEWSQLGMSSGANFNRKATLFLPVLPLEWELLSLEISSRPR